MFLPQPSRWDSLSLQGCRIWQLFRLNGHGIEIVGKIAGIVGMTGEMIAGIAAMTVEMIAGMTAATIAITTKITKKDSATGWIEGRKITGIVASATRIIPAITEKGIRLTAMGSAKATRRVIRVETEGEGGNWRGDWHKSKKPLASKSAAFCFCADNPLGYFLMVYESISLPSAAMASTFISASVTWTIKNELTESSPKAISGDLRSRVRFLISPLAPSVK